MRKVFTSFILVAALCIGACHPATTDPTNEPIDTVTAAAAPDFALRDMNGITHRLSDYRGKVVVLNFWATWCPPCKKEIPDLISLQNQDSVLGLQILGIGLDDDGIDKVKPWVESHGLNYPTLFPDTAVCQHYGGINSIPTIFFIDRKGRLRSSAVGMELRPKLDTVITPLLNER